MTSDKAKGPVPTSLLARIGWGLREGLIYGLGFFAIAAVIFLVGGGRGAASGLTLLQLFLTYAIGGASSGVVIGLLRGRRMGPVGKIVLAVLAAVPVCVVGLYTLEGGQWSDVSPVTVVVGSIIFGLSGAGIFWDDY